MIDPKYIPPVHIGAFYKIRSGGPPMKLLKTTPSITNQGDHHLKFTVSWKLDNGLMQMDIFNNYVLDFVGY